MRTPALLLGRVEVCRSFKPQQRRDGRARRRVGHGAARQERRQPRPRRAPTGRCWRRSMPGWTSAGRWRPSLRHRLRLRPIGRRRRRSSSSIQPARSGARCGGERDPAASLGLPPGGPGRHRLAARDAPVDDRMIETAIGRVPGVRAVAPVQSVHSTVGRNALADGAGRSLRPGCRFRC